MFKILSALGFFIKRNVIVSFIVYVGIIIAVPFLTSWIHKDLVEHFTLIDKKEYLSLALLLKWLIILLSISICTYRLVSLFKKDKASKLTKKESAKKQKEPLTALEKELLSQEITSPQDKLYAELKTSPKEKTAKEKTDLDNEIPIEERLLTMELKSKAETILDKMKENKKS